MPVPVGEDQEHVDKKKKKSRSRGKRSEKNRKSAAARQYDARGANHDALERGDADDED